MRRRTSLSLIKSKTQLVLIEVVLDQVFFIIYKRQVFNFQGYIGILHELIQSGGSYLQYVVLMDSRSQLVITQLVLLQSSRYFVQIVLMFRRFSQVALVQGVLV